MTVALQKIGRLRKQMDLKQVVDALHSAGDDARVKGVIAHIGSTQQFSGLAQIQELRAAVTAFRCWGLSCRCRLGIVLCPQGFEGKTHIFCRLKAAGRAATVAYADAFGEAGGFGTMSYYLASGFEKVNRPDEMTHARF